MSRDGKALTVFLIVVAVLLLSLSTITLYFYQSESKLRKEKENQVAQLQAVEAKLKEEVKNTKQQVFVLEEKAKEYDEKINNLLDELELAEGVRDEIKTENAALKEALSSQTSEKEKLQDEIASLGQKVTALEERLKTETQARSELEQEIQEDVVDLEKIVVRPGEAPQGKVVSVNKENEFVIFNLGQKSGIKAYMLLGVYRGDDYLGDVKVSRVQDDVSVADFIPPLTSQKVSLSDR